MLAQCKGYCEAKVQALSQLPPQDEHAGCALSEVDLEVVQAESKIMRSWAQSLVFDKKVLAFTPCGDYGSGESVAEPGDSWTKPLSVICFTFGS